MPRRAASRVVMTGIALLSACVVGVLGCAPKPPAGADAARGDASDVVLVDVTLGAEGGVDVLPADVTDGRADTASADVTAAVDSHVDVVAPDVSLAMDSSIAADGGDAAVDTGGHPDRVLSPDDAGPIPCGTETCGASQYCRYGHGAIDAGARAGEPWCLEMPAECVGFADCSGATDCGQALGCACFNRLCGWEWLPVRVDAATRTVYCSWSRDFCFKGWAEVKTSPGERSTHQLQRALQRAEQ